MNAVIINNKNDIIATVSGFEGREIEVAGAITIDGAPVNVRTYRVSRSKANIERARNSCAGSAVKHTHMNRVFFTI